MKKSHLYSGPPSFKADEWEREDAAFFGQLLNIMESNTWFGNTYVDIEGNVELLEELYSGKNNVNRTFDIIQEMFLSKKDNKTLSQHYADFKSLWWAEGIISHLPECEEDA